MPERELWVRLGAVLRRIRSAAGVSQSALLSRQATVSTIEAGTRLPTGEQLEAWLALASESDAAEARFLFDAAQTETESWSGMELAPDVTLQRRADEENRAARRVRNYQDRTVPGLLQTPEYAAAVFTAVGKPDVAAAVAERMRNQRVLYEPGRRFEFLILARVLDCTVAPETRDGQLAYLERLAGVDTVELGVVPDVAGDLPATQRFMMFDPLDGSPTFVTSEGLGGRVTYRGPGAVLTFSQEWDRLWSAAVTGDDASTLIREKGSAR